MLANRMANSRKKHVDTFLVILAWKFLVKVSRCDSSNIVISDGMSFGLTQHQKR